MPRKPLFAAIVAAGVVVTSLVGCERRVVEGPRADREAVQAIRASLLAKGLAGDNSAGATGGGASSAGAAGGDSAAGPAGWGTLRCQFTLAGAAPSPGKLNADKDPEVCAKEPLFDESVKVGPAGELANVCLWVRTAKLPIHPDQEQPAAAEVVLDNKGCRYEPHVAFLRTSQTLSLKNSDPIGHNVKGDCLINSPFNVIVPANGASPVTLAKEESMPVKLGCNIHPWMGGWLVVRSNPYAGVSAADGTLEIKNLPAGRELELQLWQEAAGFLKGAEGQGVSVDGKGRFKLKLEPDQQLTLRFNVPVSSLKK